MRPNNAVHRWKRPLPAHWGWYWASRNRAVGGAANFTLSGTTVGSYRSGPPWIDKPGWPEISEGGGGEGGDKLSAAADPKLVEHCVKVFLQGVGRDLELLDNGGGRPPLKD